LAPDNRKPALLVDQAKKCGEYISLFAAYKKATISFLNDYLLKLPEVVGVNFFCLVIFLFKNLWVDVFSYRTVISYCFLFSITSKSVPISFF